MHDEWLTKLLAHELQASVAPTSPRAGGSPESRDLSTARSKPGWQLLNERPLLFSPKTYSSKLVTVASVTYVSHLAFPLSSGCLDRAQKSSITG